MTTQEFWRWPETTWVAPDKDWRKAKVITGGVDVGSVSTQALVMTDGELYCYRNGRTGVDSAGTAVRAMDLALEGTGLKVKDIHYIVGTGYGRINVPFAHRTITEIACHARGANYIYGPTVRTVLDMGGQDCKAIRTDDKGRVIKFLMNDKCAAGTGRGMEVFANLLAVPIQDIGGRSLAIEEEPRPVSSTCVVFAKTEVVGLLEEGWPENKVMAAYCLAMATRVVDLLNRLGVEPDFCITGGISKNSGVVSRIERLLNIKGMKNPKHDPQVAGAIGAALFGKAIVEKERGGK